jgi:hypothetical protein
MAAKGAPPPLAPRGRLLLAALAALLAAACAERAAEEQFTPGTVHPGNSLPRTVNGWARRSLDEQLAAGAPKHRPRRPSDATQYTVHGESRVSYTGARRQNDPSAAGQARRTARSRTTSTAPGRFAPPPLCLVW